MLGSLTVFPSAPMTTSTPRTVLITGAAGNLGRAVAQAFADQGDRLVLADLQMERLADAFGASDARRLLVAVDLLDRAATQAAVADAQARFGPISVLCHLAGGFRMGEPLHETPDATWDFLLDLNARTLIHIASAVVPPMLAAGGGKIVTVGANTAGKGLAHMGPYIAAKSSVIRLTEAMSAELRERGIQVNCVLPSIIDTPENRAAMPDADPGRWVNPRDLASVIAFLASDAARAIHGAAVPVVGLS
ncbi:SDR family oxidoreductase [Ralstonia solanacearum P673]|uniref:SDR family oxidoreductase n=1 Tax=Ralstonia solanacearum TaxID=305 RepID=UPI00057D1874|nr:SDR family NAD(P)-dependent oxidoreductase [Ralstonia solanacearum]MCL9848197.1 SDR family oxidoreductase [Ralstonia solanacearum]MCL9855001.1 SDR family oxidoreductase [Ralstonia solanacearum]MCL9858666.1 SDR family oxidoreductase [Ralstonia solanacearum]MCL9863209.1 SDR family oxidoreductase [Ralstonia solanacearum]MCL9867808.1 SDR family oxidoreductase [Ralstonia solanacearum]